MSLPMVSKNHSGDLLHELHTLRTRPFSRRRRHLLQLLYLIQLTSVRSTSTLESLDPLFLLSVINPDQLVSWVSQSEPSISTPTSTSVSTPTSTSVSTPTSDMQKKNRRGGRKSNRGHQHSNSASATTFPSHPPPATSQQAGQYSQVPNDGMLSHGTPITNQAAHQVPFYDTSYDRPVLPSISTFDQPAPSQLPYTYSGYPPVAQVATPAHPAIPAQAYHGPPLAVSIPHTTHPVSHFRTSSIASSAGQSYPAQLSGSVVTDELSPPVNTPNGSSGPNVTWQSGVSTHSDGSAARPVSDDVVGFKPTSRSGTAPQPQSHVPGASAHHNIYATPMPPLAPAQAPQPFPSPTGILPADAPPSSVKPDIEPGLKVQKSGGKAYVSNEERATITPTSHAKNWEDGFCMDFFCSPTNPRAGDNLHWALRPTGHGRRPWDKSIFAELASHPLYFNNTRSAKYVYERFVDCKSVLKDIQRYSRFYRIDFNRPGDADVEGILQEIQSGMNIINRGHSIKIQTSAFRFYLWVINNWWHWARVTDLMKSNDVQTTTTRRSGAISPVSVTSAPSVLPSQTSTHLPSQAPAALLPVTQTLASPHLPVRSSEITRPSIQLPAQLRRPSVQTFATSPPPNQASMPLNQPTREPAPPAALVPTSMPPPVPESLAELQGSRAHPASAPNASPASSFRVSRGASAARLARWDASESVYARSTTSSSHTGQTHTQSESSSAAGLSRIGGTPFVVSETAGVQLVRQNQRQLELNEENSRVSNRALELIQQTLDLERQESTQQKELEQTRLQLNQASAALDQARSDVNQIRRDLEQTRVHLAQERARLDEDRRQFIAERRQFEERQLRFNMDRMALHTVHTQMAMGTLPQPAPASGVTMGDHHPRPNISMAVRPHIPNFNELLDQVRAYHAHALGMPELVPRETSQSYYSTPPSPPATQSHGAGSSNHTTRLRGLTPQADSPPDVGRFEDIGTVRGSPPRDYAEDDASTDDEQRMEVEEGSPTKNHGKQKAV